MSKRSGKLRHQRRTRSGTRPDEEPTRIPELDLFRGLAIVLMVIDHVAWVFGQPIEPWSIRGVTRLAMPWFCWIMGYLLADRDAAERWWWRGSGEASAAGGRPANWQRWWQLVGAAVVVNVFYFPITGQLEILASLALTWLLWAVLRNGLVWGSVAFLLYRWDPTAGAWGRAWLDYPLSLVLPCVAQGMIWRLLGGRFAVAISAMTALGLLVADAGGWSLIARPSLYVLVAAPIAGACVVWARRGLPWRLAWLEWLGKRPLRAYVCQYALVLLLRQLV
ncbi:MAG: hypothetical protein KatS3mg111_0660 [Pirellulaceae bacterium]|nr:MAG: hypothetical protein KatS3mg111_0660 [Pirellulaceae bacterium]